MSWEETTRQKRTCPCGSGQYTAVFLSDDWGRYDEHWEMDCPGCKNLYDLHVSCQKHKGMTETRRGWVLKPLLEKSAHLREEIDLEKCRLATYAQSHYSNLWHNHFEDRTKKAVWAELTQDGSSYPSLSTFYSHVRSNGLPQVLDGYLCFYKIPTVIRVLEVADKTLDRMVQDIESLERKSAEHKAFVCTQVFA